MSLALDRPLGGYWSLRLEVFDPSKNTIVSSRVEEVGTVNSEIRNLIKLGKKCCARNSIVGRQWIIPLPMVVGLRSDVLELRMFLSLQNTTNLSVEHGKLEKPYKLSFALCHMVCIGTI